MKATKRALLKTWKMMQNRCYNENTPRFQNYGARGIKVCDRWRNSFLAFVADVGERPEGCTLDRIDNDGDYCPENVRWSTQREQLLNRRNTVRVSIDGVSYLAADLALESGLKTDTIVKRAAIGLSLEEVLDPRRRTYTAGLALGGKASGAKQRTKTHCPRGHEYSEENTYFTKEGWRSCRRCKAEKQLARTRASRVS